MGSLLASHSNLMAWFLKICTKCLTPKQREVFGDSCSVSALSLPRTNGEAGNHSAKEAWQDGDSAQRKGMNGYPSNGHAPGAQLSKGERFSTQFSPETGEHAIAMQLAHDMNIVSCQTLEIWHKLLNVMTYSYREITTLP